MKDSALLLNVLAGHDIKDTTSSFLPIEEYKDNKTLTIIKEIYDDLKDKTIKKAFDELIKGLKEKGYKINTV